jgi:hypothetical protein
MARMTGGEHEVAVNSTAGGKERLAHADFAINMDTAIILNLRGCGANYNSDDDLGLDASESPGFIQLRSARHEQAKADVPYTYRRTSERRRSLSRSAIIIMSCPHTHIPRGSAAGTCRDRERGRYSQKKLGLYIRIERREGHPDSRQRIPSLPLFLTEMQADQQGSTCRLHDFVRHGRGHGGES